MTTTEELRKKAIEASKKAYSPYSKAQVGTALIADDGQVYTGCNVENCSYGGTICAERVAIVKAISSGARAIKSIYVYTDDGWSPCGICRQVIAEFTPQEATVTIGSKNKPDLPYKVSELLPNSFLPESLDSLTQSVKD